MWRKVTQMSYIGADVLSFLIEMGYACVFIN